MTQDERFDRIDASLARLHASFSHVDASTESLTGILLEFREDTARSFEGLVNRLDILTATVAKIDIHMTELERAILEFGNITEQITGSQAYA